jgi:hypothetical protein
MQLSGINETCRARQLTPTYAKKYKVTHSLTFRVTIPDTVTIQCPPEDEHGIARIM